PDYETGVKAVVKEAEELARREGYDEVIPVTLRAMPLTHHRIERIAYELGAELDSWDTELWVSEEDRRRAEEIWRGWGFGEDEFVVALHRRGANIYKYWDVGEAQEVVDYLKERYGAEVIAFETHTDLNREPAKQLEGVYSTADLPELPLKVSAALIEKCKLFIGLDSGPMWLATTTKTPIIALFTMTWMHQSAPLREKSLIVASRKAWEMATEEFKERHRNRILRDEAGGTKIKAETVIEAIDRFGFMRPKRLGKGKGREEERDRDYIRYLGPLFNPTGWSQACRHNIMAISQFAEVIPVNITIVDMNYQNEECKKILEMKQRNWGHSYSKTIFHCNLRKFYYLFDEDKENYAYVVYESKVLDKELKEILSSMPWNKIIVPSEFVKDVLVDNDIKKPISVVPHVFKEYEPLPIQGLDRYTSKLKFYTINDWTPRKNLPALIRAYFETFTKSDDVVLIVKTSSWIYPRDKIAQEISRIKMDFTDAPDIVLLFGFFDDGQISYLHKIGDVFVSATHSEAWGLTGFEAMGYGNPVIQTFWGGTKDYMNYEISYPISEGVEDYLHIEPPFTPQHGDNDIWFYPDMNRFKEVMRYCYEHIDEAKERGKKAREHIRRNYSLDVISKRFREVLT
ncbi:MAG: hypothetical protein DRI61_12320, partial [Chloroflexi bacterium]